jgi:hypothetical protein
LAAIAFDLNPGEAAVGRGALALWAVRTGFIDRAGNLAFAV